jgi:hypothetical protein
MLGIIKLRVSAYILQRVAPTASNVGKQYEVSQIPQSENVGVPLPQNFLEVIERVFMTTFSFSFSWLFNNFLIINAYVLSDDRMIDELERIWKEAVEA